MSGARNPQAGAAWHVHEQGEANEYALVADDNRWVVALRLNGEFFDNEQRQLIAMIVETPAMLVMLRRAFRYLEGRTLEGPGQSLRAELRAMLARLPAPKS